MAACRLFKNYQSLIDYDRCHQNPLNHENDKEFIKCKKNPIGFIDLLIFLFVDANLSNYTFSRF